MNNQLRVALVTGANKGIGYAIATGLGRLGFTVVVAARNEHRRDDAVANLRALDIDASGLTLDVTDDRSVDAAAALVADRYGHLDVLVNNAGVTGGWAQEPTKVAPETVRAAVETNVIGTIRVTNALLPLLLAADQPRIVNISSGGASLSWQTSTEADGWLSAAYAPSKTMLNAVTIQYAKELAGTPIKINVVDPGYTATDFTNFYGERTPTQAAAVAVELATIPDDGPTGQFFSEAGPVAW
jgi:NAD(P)-dependent dehydrogenase (short-subunit alcohol dehydrogenase family)